MGLNNLQAPAGARKKRKKRVGRGQGSGWGGTAGRGDKGQLSRSGASSAVGFEGGQMPLQRRLPKRGFKNFCRREFTIVHVGDLMRFEDNAVVDPAAMSAVGLIRRETVPVKILADGDLKKPLTVRAQGFSQAARKKIESAGGKAEVIEMIRRSTKTASTKES
jgi:large subunit ribosomal protein L15